MAETPQVESSNVLTLDYQDNPDLREVFGRKEVGAKCKLTLQLQVMSKYPEGVQCAIEKVITDEYGEDGEEKEATATEKEPIMATIRNRHRKNRGMMGPHGRPPQTAENSNEPWMTSYV